MELLLLAGLVVAAFLSRARREDQTVSGGPGPSYESILNSPTEPPSHQFELTNAQLTAPLLDQTLITRCGVPDSMNVKIQVAIKMGRAIGVTVTTSPASRVIAACIDQSVRRMQWPVSTKTDFVTTTY